MNEDRTLYCTFETAGRLFGVPVLDVKEVATETRFAQIPHAPTEVLGLVNIRGHIFLALNLAQLLSIKNHEIQTGSQLVLFKATVGPAFGIVVDRVCEIVSVASDQIEAFSGEERAAINPNDRGELVSHVCKLDGQLLIVLAPRKFLPCLERTFPT